MDYNKEIYIVKLRLSSDVSMFDLSIFDARLPLFVDKVECRTTENTIVMPVKEDIGLENEEYRQTGEKRIYKSTLLKIQRDRANINFISLFVYCNKRQINKAKRKVISYCRSEIISIYQRKLNAYKRSLSYLDSDLWYVNILWDSYARSQAEIKIESKPEFDRLKTQIADFITNNWHKRTMKDIRTPDGIVKIIVKYSGIEWSNPTHEDFYIFDNGIINPCMYCRVYYRNSNSFFCSIPVWFNSNIEILKDVKNGWCLPHDSNITTENNIHYSEKYRFEFHNVENFIETNKPVNIL